MQGDDKPFDELKRELQEIVRALWVIVDQHTNEIRGLRETLENISTRQR